MSIGLFDQDLRYHSRFPNLELMKISSFYKKRHEIVKLSLMPDFKRFNQFYIAKDLGRADKGLSNLIRQAQNSVFVVGRATYPTYKPLPDAIEIMPQDVTLYDNIDLQELYEMGKSEIAFFQSILRGINLRLSLDGHNIWDKYPQQLRNSQYGGIVIHDYNAGAILNGAEEAYKLHNQFRCPARIRFKFPLKFWDFKQMTEWLSIPFNMISTKFEFFGLMDYLQFRAFLRYCTAFPVSEPLRFTYCPTGAASDENDFAKNYLPKFYLQIIKQRNANVIFSLKYEKGILIDPRWADVFMLLQEYLRFVTVQGTDKVEHYTTCQEFIEAVMEMPRIRAYTFKVSKPLIHIQNAISLLKEKSPITYRYIFDDNIYNLRSIT